MAILDANFQAPTSTKCKVEIAGSNADLFICFFIMDF